MGNTDSDLRKEVKVKNQIYLAGKISGIPFADANNWRMFLSNGLKTKSLIDSWKCFNPCAHIRTNGSAMYDSEYFMYDLDQLRRSRLVIVSFEFGQDSIGTAMEVAVAFENRIPIIGYNPGEIEVHPWYDMALTHMCYDMDGLILFLCDHYFI